MSDWSSDVCSSDLGFLADGDPAQYRALVHHLVLDQAEVLEAHASAGVGLFRRVLRGADPRDPGFEFEHETRDQVGAVHAQRAQGLHVVRLDAGRARRSEEHTSELQSLMRISYAVFCLKKKN